MTKIDDYTIRRIKEAAKIYDVVADFVELRKTGVRFTGICPFHDDHHTGNFIVYPKQNVFKCFACEAKGGPVEFVMRRMNVSFPEAICWLGKKYNIDTKMETTFTPPPPRPVTPPPPMLILPMRMVTARENLQGDPLIEWIYKGVNWDAAQRHRIPEVLADYHVGHSRQGMTIFWEIDDEQRVRSGKMMLYRHDGHRNRDARYKFDFIHAALFRDKRLPEYDEDKFTVKHCLFGLHLIDRYTMNIKQDVCIVESEKTALLMAIAYGNHPMQVWMACGGLKNLTREKLKPIIDRGRDIILYPDRDGIEKWKEHAATIGYDRIRVDAKPVTEWWKPEDGPKADIADVVIRMINEKKIYKTVDDVVKDLPVLKKLHEKLNLEISEN